LRSLAAELVHEIVTSARHAVGRDKNRFSVGQDGSAADQNMPDARWPRVGEDRIGAVKK